MWKLCKPTAKEASPQEAREAPTPGLQRGRQRLVPWLVRPVHGERARWRRRRGGTRSRWRRSKGGSPERGCSGRPWSNVKSNSEGFGMAVRARARGRRRSKRMRSARPDRPGAGRAPATSPAPSVLSPKGERLLINTHDKAFPNPKAWVYHEEAQNAANQR